MAYQHVLYQTGDGIASITVNRPPLNVLNQQAMDELEQALISARDDAEVRVVILTGAGEEAFIAGGDITEIRDMVSKGPLHAREAFARRGQRLVTTVERLGKPVIAAVNGYALGGAGHLARVESIRAADRATLTRGYSSMARCLRCRYAFRTAL